jgi:hypothetical protein
MSRHHLLLISHVLFALLVGALASTGLMASLLHRRIPVVLILILGLTPLLTITSWRAAINAPSKSLRGYFLAFRWLSLTFWAANVWIAWIILSGPSLAIPRGPSL